MRIKFILTNLVIFCFLCNPNIIIAQKKSIKPGLTKLGKLFIIGGGEKTIPLMQDLIKTAGISPNEYVIVLPMSSEVPDSAVIWTREDFATAGFHNVTGFNFLENIPPDPDKIDSLKNARLIFISGGDQNKFMKIVQKGPIYEAIHYAFKNGATIAGTSAGAAVMSKKMITGNSLKYPEYTGKYPSIEPENIEIKEGLGLIDKLIVDQHFIKRQRMNRLIAVSLEHPEEVCVGIDESTAIVVAGNSFRVTGENQVIVLSNKNKSRQVKDNLLGGKNLMLDILLPGELFRFK
jgi:cyanophycinase